MSLSQIWIGTESEQIGSIQMQVHLDLRLILLSTININEDIFYLKEKSI
jgi:hypothetical protein